MKYSRDLSDERTILQHLSCCSDAFVPPLSSRVDLREYASKLARHATRFEIWDEGVLVALLACYADVEQPRFFVSNVSVLPTHARRGMASSLLGSCAAWVGGRGGGVIRLEVSKDNAGAIALYTKEGFEPIAVNTDHLVMARSVRPGSRRSSEAPAGP